MIGYYEGLLGLKKVVDILLCIGQKNLVCRFLEGGEDVDQPLLFVFAPHIKVLFILEEDVKVPVGPEDRVGGQAAQVNLVLGNSFLHNGF